MTTPSSPQGNTAYRNGLRIDCRTTRHSPGRTRCNDCHTVWQQPLTVAPVAVDDRETFMQRLARRKGITVDMDVASWPANAGSRSPGSRAATRSATAAASSVWKGTPP